MHRNEKSLELVGISIGGGKIEIIEMNGFKLRLSGNHPAIFVVHHDRYGVIAAVSNLLAKHEMNIGHMEVSRKEKGEEALMVMEVDQNVEQELVDELRSLPNIKLVSNIYEYRIKETGCMFRNAAELMELAESDGISISEVMIRQEVEVTKQTREQCI